MIYMPNFADQRVIDFCTGHSQRPDLDGFYKSLCAELGVTGGQIDELWKQYLTGKYGTYLGPNINAYENEADFEFSASDAAVLWEDSTSVDWEDGTSIDWES